MISTPQNYRYSVYWLVSAPNANQNNIVFVIMQVKNTLYRILKADTTVPWMILNTRGFRWISNALSIFFECFIETRWQCFEKIFWNELQRFLAPSKKKKMPTFSKRIKMFFFENYPVRGKNMLITIFCAVIGHIRNKGKGMLFECEQPFVGRHVAWRHLKRLRGRLILWKLVWLYSCTKTNCHIMLRIACTCITNILS